MNKNLHKHIYIYIEQVSTSNLETALCSNSSRVSAARETPHILVW